MEDKRVTRFAAGHVPASSTGPTARHAIRGLALHCSLPAPPAVARCAPAPPDPVPPIPREPRRWSERSPTSQGCCGGFRSL